MNRKSKELKPDQRLREIGYVLARGVVRMKEAGELLTTRSEDEINVLQKPSKPVNHWVAG